MNFSYLNKEDKRNINRHFEPGFRSSEGQLSLPRDAHSYNSELLITENLNGEGNEWPSENLSF